MNRDVYLILGIFFLFVGGMLFLIRHTEIESENVYALSLGKRREESSVDPLTILFTGDIMLDRGVEYYSEQDKNSFYPFVKIASFFQEDHLVIGNLEGAIVENPPYFGPHSYRFAFSPEAASSLSSSHFDVVSLANNHTHDMRGKGFQETKRLLKEEGLDSFGHPVSCEKELAHQEKEVVLFAANRTFPFNCSPKEIVKQVRGLRDLYSEKFLVTIFHWGQEYRKQNSSLQQKLAHSVIEAGADLVIGHHPHVVQNIEKYQGKLIFYSLGNFIFDQDFSEETKQGLVVKLEGRPDHQTYTLYPVQINKGQVSLMKKSNLESFLGELAKNSGQDLSESIQKGVIEIND